MRLPPPTATRLTDQLAEFDIWITASLGEIRDSERFQIELDRIADLFEALAEHTNEFKDVSSCKPSAVADALTALCVGKLPDDAFATLHSAAALLFLVTGKSDNNAKCQLPLHIRDHAGRTELPAHRTHKGKTRLARTPIPRVLKADKYMRLVAQLADCPEEQQQLLRDFVSFLLSDDKCVAQLWSIGHSYVMLKPHGRSRDLLTPLVIFQVRGSVSASGGHEPERLLRERLAEWGLEADKDYNINDVVIDNSGDLNTQPARGEAAAEDEGAEDKTRAYDFVLPYQTPSWARRVFVQCQFYAGDSGSVSHKNIDQTDTSRRKVSEQYAEPVFVEYVDGAGYFASLNGDLKKLLRKQSTGDFFQVRSAPIRLRRVLQAIGFLTLLEVEHSIMITGGDCSMVRSHLCGEGYSGKEIDRTIADGIASRKVTANGSSLSVTAERRETARRYLLLDVVACNGASLGDRPQASRGHLLIPGYGPLYGMRMQDAVSAAMGLSESVREDWCDARVMMGDVQWLVEQGFMIS